MERQQLIDKIHANMLMTGQGGMDSETQEAAQHCPMEKLRSLESFTAAAISSVTPFERGHPDRDGSRFEQERCDRIRNGPVKVLFHQTDADSANKIMSGRTFLSSMGGTRLFGHGIYFAETPEDTDRKCLKRGVILRCEVHLGNTKEFFKPASYLEGEELLRDGYDSVVGRFMRTVPEWVVYNKDQVHNIEAL